MKPFVLIILTTTCLLKLVGVTTDWYYLRERERLRINENEYVCGFVLEREREKESAHILEGVDSWFRRQTR